MSQTLTKSGDCNVDKSPKGMPGQQAVNERDSRMSSSGHVVKQLQRELVAALTGTNRQRTNCSERGFLPLADFPVPVLTREGSWDSDLLAVAGKLMADQTKDPSGPTPWLFLGTPELFIQQ